MFGSQEQNLLDNRFSLGENDILIWNKLQLLLGPSIDLIEGAHSLSLDKVVNWYQFLR